MCALMIPFVVAGVFAVPMAYKAGQRTGEFLKSKFGSGESLTQAA